MKLSRKQKLRARWFAGGRTTVGQISIYNGMNFVDFFVGKLRGQIVSCPENNNFKWLTRQAAWNCAVRFRDHARKLAA